MQDILDIIKANSNIPDKVISEESTSIDVASTIDIVSELIDEKYNDSLGYLISEVTPLSSTWGTFYTSGLSSQSKDFEIIKKDIYTKTFTVDTGYTREVWQDVLNMFGKRAKKQAGSILSGISASVENTDVISRLSASSDTKPTLYINVGNSAWITSQISQRVAESVIEMNRHTFKTLDSFCVLSPKWASAFLGASSYIKNDNNSASKNATLFLGRYGRTDFYVNPFDINMNSFSADYNNDYTNTNSPLIPDYAYVGLKSNTTGYSSLIFAPYQYESQIVPDPDTGDEKLFLYNRYGLITSPFHKPLEGQSMLHKFIITEAP